MRSRSNTRHTSLCLGVCSLITVLGTGLPKAAASGGVECSAVYDAGVEQERAGHLSDALDIFQSCAADSCRSPARQQCEAKILRLELDAPSVVPLAKDAAGAPLLNVEVTMDGVPLTSRLDGRAYRVDPGLHEFVFSADGEELSSQELVIAQGQRNREIWLELPAEPVAVESEPDTEPAAALSADEQRPDLNLAPAHLEAALPPPVAIRANDARESHVNLTPYFFAGGALLGGGAYILLSSWARGDNSKLSQCSPNCSPSAVSHIRTLYTAADITLGVAAAAAVTSAALFIFTGSSSSSERTDRGYALSVQPERNGALATVRGSL